MADTIPTTKLFVDMTDDELREAYRAWRTVAWNWSQMACPRRRDPRPANGMGRAMRNVEMIERIANRKGVRLS